MPITQEATWAASPSTTRGQPTKLHADAKGERIAYASNKSIFLRNIDAPEVGKQYTGHTAQTTVARFSPSGFYIASGDVAGNVRVWDAVGEGATKGEYHILAGRINDIAWDGDSQRIIAVGDGKERFGHCFTADSGNSVGEILGQSQPINAVSIRQQRPLRAATVSDDLSLAFFHGAPFKFNLSSKGQHNKYIYGTAFSPDGSTLVSVGADRKIWLYDGKTGEATKQIGEGEHQGSIFAVSWSKDSKHFATASADQTVKVWDAEAGKCTRSWRMGGDAVHVPSQQMGVVWPHGRNDDLIISIDLDGNLNYLYPGNDKPSKVVRGHQGSITAIALSTNPSPTLYTGSFEGRIRAWDVSKGEASTIDGEGHSNYISGIASSETSIKSISWDDTLRSIDVSVKTFVGSLLKISSQPKSVAVSKSNITVVATAETIELSSASAELISSTPLPESPATSIAATKDGVIAVGTAKSSVLIYALNASTKPTLSLTKTIKDSSISSAPSALSFSPSGGYLAVGTSGGRICVFDTSSWSLETSRWSSHTARVTSLSWNAESTHAVSGSLDTNVHVWSLKSPGFRLKAGNAHKDGVSGVVWVDGEKVISTGSDAAVKTWKVTGLS